MNAYTNFNATATMLRMNTKKKIVKLETLKRKISFLRKQKKKIAFTNGCFDIIHYGHVSYLQAIKKENRILIVGLNSDVSIKKIKGPNRPIIPQFERASVLAALECVDYITIFDEETPLNVITALKPDFLFKGADWRGKGIVGSDVVRACGGKIEYIKYIPKISSTNIIETIISRQGKGNL